MLSNFHFQLSNNLEVPIIGVNTKLALGNLFNGETLDIISGLLTGGLYHLNTGTCPNGGNLDGNTDDEGNDTYNVSDIVILVNCILVSHCDGLEFTCAADVNGDTNYNVLDIVQLANCILAQNCGG